jgi:nucleoside-diphosphate-sugar epimerase
MNLKNVHVVRLSNVFGPGHTSHNFLDSLIEDAIRKRHVNLETSLASSRDYLWIGDAVNMIIAIAERGKRRIYDLAFGKNRTTDDIMRIISAVTGCSCNVHPGAPTVTFPGIDVTPLREEFEYQPSDVLEILGNIVDEAKKSLGK